MIVTSSKDKNRNARDTLFDCKAWVRAEGYIVAAKHKTYYFGRLNLIGPSKGSSLVEGVSSIAVLEARGQRWGFYDSRVIETDQGQFLTAYLVKYRPTDEEEVVVPERHLLEEKSIENRVTAKSRFFLQAETKLIAFHPVGTHISRQLFTHRFAQVFENTFNNFFVGASIQFIESEDLFLSQFRLFSRIDRVTVQLHPSNPSNRDLWRRQDQRLKELGATGYSEVYEGRGAEPGLKVKDDGDINQKIAMAEDGYGKVEVAGQQNGKFKKISTGRSPINVLAPADLDSPDGVLPYLQETFKEIMKRFKHDDE